MVNSPDLQFGGSGFDHQQNYMPGAHQASYPLGVGKLVLDWGEWIYASESNFTDQINVHNKCSSLTFLLYSTVTAVAKMLYNRPLIGRSDLAVAEHDSPK